MRARVLRIRCLAGGALATLLVLASAAGAALAADPEPGSPEWQQRDLANAQRMTGRTQDQLAHPEYLERMFVDGTPIGIGNLTDQAAHPDRPIITASQLIPGARGADIYRWRWEQQGRGIQVPIEYENRYGARIQGEVWAPPDGFVDPVTGQADDGRYPGVVITTGSLQGYKELYWWAAQGLAEAGYVVMTYDVQGQGKSEAFGHDEETGFVRCAPNDCPGFPFQQADNFIEGTEDALDWFLSRRNPLREMIDRRRLGLAGHSLGAAAVTDVGNRDKRVDAVVAWDNANLPDDVEPRAPTMGQNAEAGFWPQTFSNRPDPDSSNETFRRFREAGVPAMQLALQGSTHLEWSYIPYVLMASNDGERVGMYYTLAWFDRWLKGERHGRARGKALRRHVRRQASDARQRLTASRFDDSADASAIGTGGWDPAEGNVTYRIEGIPIEDRLSFYFRSSYAFGRMSCNDMLAGC